MASPIPPMLIELQLETAKIQAQMGQLQKNFESFGKTVEHQTSFLSKFKATAAGVFAGNLMVTGLQAIKGAMMGAIHEAEQYEVMMNKMNAVITSTGNVAGLSAEGLMKQASALESISMVDEGVIQQGELVLATFTQVRNSVGANNDIFNQATKAALDMSTVMGGDMAGSATMLGKALNDPIVGMGALRRNGVTFTEEQKAMVKQLMQSGDVLGAQKIILQEVNREFGGAAKAAGDTFAGAVFRAKDKVSDFARDLVMGLQPILLSIGKTLGDLINKYIAPLIGFIQKNKEAFLVFVGVLGTAFVAFKTYQGILKLITVAQAAFNAVLAANPITLVVVGIAALAAAFVYAWNKFQPFRDGIVKGLQIIVNAIGYLVGGVGTLLKAMSSIPGIGDKFKGASDAVNKAANDIRNFSNNLDKLKDKKIGLSFGGTKTAADLLAGAAGEALAPTATTGQIAAAKKRADDLKKAQEDASKIYADMDKVIKDSAEKRAKIDKDYFDKKTELITKEAEKELALRQDFAKKAIDLESKAYADRAAVVKKSQDLLRSAFEAGAKFDINTLFTDSDQSASGLLTKMKEKLKSIQKLQEQAGELASKGYSQTFIQEVIAQGPEVGGKMAEAIINATPETAKELQDLYKQLQVTSKHGLDALAKQMSTSTSLATEELVAEYKQIDIDLRNALYENNVNLNEALASAQKDLQASLLDAQNAYNQAIEDLTNETMAKLADLQAELAKTALLIAQLSGMSIGVQTMANSPAAPYFVGGSSGDTIVDNSTTVTVNAPQNSNAGGISQEVLNAIKYGNAITSTGSGYDATWTPNYTSVAPGGNGTAARPGGRAGSTSARGD